MTCFQVHVLGGEPSAASFFIAWQAAWAYTSYSFFSRSFRKALDRDGSGGAPARSGGEPRLPALVTRALEVCIKELPGPGSSEPQ